MTTKNGKDAGMFTQRCVVTAFVATVLMNVFATAQPQEPEPPHPTTPAPRCTNATYADVAFTVCRADPAHDALQIFLRDQAGRNYGQFAAIETALNAEGETLAFAMNAGMFHIDRTPVGLFIEDGDVRAPLNTATGRGNFYIKPNGVFFLTKAGDAGVVTTDVFAQTYARENGAGAGLDAIALATQSGPMLVVEGEIAPRLLPHSTSRFVRNGVGVTAQGDVVFAIANAPVNFHTFASLFRDELGAVNALYLDGAISRLHAPELGRSDPGVRLGPTLGAVTAQHAPTP